MSYSSLFNTAQDFVKVYKNANVNSETVDAAIVEFVNTYSVYANGKEFMVTEDLYQTSRYINGEPVRTKEFEEKLLFVKKEMLLANEEVSEIIDSFIDFYMRGKM